MDDLTRRKCRPRRPLFGERFGNLVVIARTLPNKTKNSFWVCECDCGGQILSNRGRLETGYTAHCGCKTVRHHLTPEERKIYNVWCSMKERCSKPNHKGYKDYGGRGIQVCDRWLVFKNFMLDMGPRPKSGTLERINNDKGYNPENCKWASIKEQNRNNRNTRLVTYNGITLCLTDWAEKIGIHMTGLSYRLKHWPIERAMTELNNSK